MPQSVIQPWLFRSNLLIQTPMEQPAGLNRSKRCPAETEAWILGSGTSSLASALYLIKDAQVPPSKVHILDSHDSVGQILHQAGNPSKGYDQFAGCLPVPIGVPLKELPASIPSAGVAGHMFPRLHTPYSIMSRKMDPLFTPTTDWFAKCPLLHIVYGVSFDVWGIRPLQPQIPSL